MAVGNNNFREPADNSMSNTEAILTEEATAVNQVAMAMSPSKIALKRKQSLDSIRSQMEFYFGDANLTRDRFLLSYVEQDPYVPLEIFLAFNKIKTLTQDVQEIATALSNSDSLELDETGLKVRRKTALPKNRDVKAKMLYVEALPLTVTRDWLKEVFSRYGAVSFVSLPHYPGTQKLKGFAFIEFEENSAVEQALDAYAQVQGVLSLKHTDPANLASIRSFHLQQQMESSSVVANDSNFGKDDLKVDKDTEFLQLSETNTFQNKKEEDVMDIEPNAMKLKILSKSGWCTLRNKYLNKQRRMDEANANANAISNNKISDSQTVAKHLQNKQNADVKKINNYICGAGGSEAACKMIGKEEDEVNKPSSLFKYKLGLIVECTLREPCNILKDFRANMRQYSNIKYIDIKPGNQVAYLRMGTATAAENLVRQHSSAEIQFKLLSGEPEIEYWRKIEEYQRIKLSKNMGVPQKRRRKNVPKLSGHRH